MSKPKVVVIGVIQGEVQLVGHGVEGRCGDILSCNQRESREGEQRGREGRGRGERKRGREEKKRREKEMKERGESNYY